MKVLFITNIPSPYRVHFFNELGKLCDLTVVFERAASAERDDSWKIFSSDYFKAVVLKGINSDTDKAFCPDVVRFIKKGLFDRVIVTNFSTPTGLLAISWLRLKKIPYFLESDGGFPKNGKGIKERVKRFFIKGAAGYFSTADMHDQYYLQYGAKPDRLHRYAFTSLYRADILERPVSKEERRTLREKLGMTEERIVLSVGQFIRRKGFDVLLDALAKMPKDIGCYIVGGQPTQAYIDQVQKLGLENIHFVGFKSKEELAEYFMAADLFSLPTREDIWGLVVNEAMAKGLPVVTTDRCVAGLELIKDPAVGRLVPVEDAAGLAEAMEAYLPERDMCDSNAVLERIRKYTFEEMARQHIEVLSEF